MENELIKLMQDQERDLRELLELLETQYKMIMSKDVFGLEGLVDELGVCGKKIAQEEVERRKLIGEQSLKEFVNESHNNELKKAFNGVKTTLNNVISRKETNDMLLKKEAMYNSKMLAILNPSKENKIYNSYGNLSK